MPLIVYSQEMRGEELIWFGQTCLGNLNVGHMDQLIGPLMMEVSTNWAFLLGQCVFAVREPLHVFHKLVWPSSHLGCLDCGGKRFSKHLRY